MKIIVLGGEGMLGHKMFQTVRNQYPDTFCTIIGSLHNSFYKTIDIFQSGNIIENINVLDFTCLQNTLNAYRPDYIINCIGIIKQREEAKAAIPSITINSLLPHRLAEWAQGWGGRIIHFSTDCVFSGKKGNYTEEDLSDAEDLYGKTKFLGEVTVENALTLRTSIIGRELSQFQSLLEWFLSQKGKTIRGYRRVIYSGVTTNYLAELCARIIADYPALSGLYQVTSPAISKLDLLNLLRDAYQLDIRIVPDENEISDRSMVGEKFIQATGYTYPQWADLMEQLAKDPTPYAKWR